MAGNFVNTNHKNILNLFTDVKKEVLKNPFYIFNDQKATVVDYFQINNDRTTLDEALKIQYSDLGENSPFRFNLIHDFYIYGIERIATSLDNGEYGLESNEISGEAFILPKSIQPYPGDYFKINYLKNTGNSFLFKITEVQVDTLNNYSNIYKVSYVLERMDLGLIQNQVTDEYEFIPKNVGTKLNCVIKKSKYSLLEKLDEIASTLKAYYKDLFYNEKVQTFTFEYYLTKDNFYDPYLIEFLSKHHIMSVAGSNYIYVQHMIPVGKTFTIDYARTFYHALETRDIGHFCSSEITTDAQYINNPMSIFSTRLENYFRLTHHVMQQQPLYKVISMLPTDFIANLSTHTLYEDKTYTFLNIIIKYLYKDEITHEDIIQLENVMYAESNVILFFSLPMVIYCIEKTQEELISINS